MRRNFLRFLATFTFRYAGLILPLFLALTGASLWLVADRMRIDTSLAAFLPPASPEMKNIGEIVSDYRKLEPVMVTAVPARALVGVKEVTTGGGMKVKFVAEVPVPSESDTVMAPDAPVPTVATSVVSFITVNVAAAAPPKFTALAPVKSLPEMVTTVPLPPVVGLKPVMVGSGP